MGLHSNDVFARALVGLSGHLLVPGGDRSDRSRGRQAAATQMNTCHLSFS